MDKRTRPHTLRTLPLKNSPRLSRTSAHLLYLPSLRYNTRHTRKIKKRSGQPEHLSSVYVLLTFRIRFKMHFHHHQRLSGVQYFAGNARLGGLPLANRTHAYRLLIPYSVISAFPHYTGLPPWLAICPRIDSPPGNHPPTKKRSPQQRGTPFAIYDQDTSSTGVSSTSACSR